MISVPLFSSKVACLLTLLLVSCNSIFPVVVWEPPAAIDERTLEQFVVTVRVEGDIPVTPHEIAAYLREDYPNAIVDTENDPLVDGTLPYFVVFILETDPHAATVDPRYGSANSGMGLAWVYADAHQCNTHEGRVLSISNTASHEIGHLLGMVHVKDRFAFMATNQPRYWKCAVNADGRVSDPLDE